MHRALQGRCGLFCGECKIYVAYSTNNAATKKEIARAAGKVKGRNLAPEQVKCLGCKGTMASTWRTNCAIRACAEERGMEFCYQCRLFPCEQLQTFHETHPQAQENLKTISKIGPDAWLHNILFKGKGTS